MIRKITSGTPQDFYCVKDGQGSIMLLLATSGYIACSYEYDALGNCKILYGADGIGSINPFRWKGFYFDTETGLYYANGSYYDPETMLYVDAQDISSVAEKAYDVRGLDRNGIVCDNILALAGNPTTVFSGTQLSPDYDYDPGKTWWEKITSAIHNWWRSIPPWLKVLVGAILIVAAVAMTAVTGGGTLGGVSAVTMAAKSALINLAVGVGFATVGWVIGSAISGDWSLGELENDIADAVFFVGVFMFISASISAIKHAYRAEPHSISQAVEKTKELTDAELKVFGEPGINPGFRQMIGTHDDAMAFVRSQTRALKEIAPGKFVGTNSRNVMFVVYDRPLITYPGPYTSIRITGVSGLKGIKFMWP